LHYRARIFLLGPVEFDHADLYRDLDAVLTAFRAGTAQVPRHGTVVVNAQSPASLEGVRDTSAEVVKVGVTPDCALRLGETLVERGSDVTHTSLDWQGRNFNLRLPMPGRHNAENAAMALAGALAAELDPDAILDAISRFPGVARRMDTIGEASGIVVIDGFAHHPTALAVTIKAARSRWPDRRLVIAFEPRSLTAARRDFQDRYVEALSKTDVALVASPFHSGRLDPKELIDRIQLAVELENRGVHALMPSKDDDPVEALIPSLRSGDMVIGCSSGDFGNFHRRLLDRLKGEEDR